MFHCVESAKCKEHFCDVPFQVSRNEYETPGSKWFKFKMKTIALHYRAPNHPSTLNWVDSKRVCIKEGMGCFDIAQQCFRHDGCGDVSRIQGSLPLFMLAMVK